MGLWLEHRDAKGQLTDRARFSEGSVTMTNLTEFIEGGDTGVSPSFTIAEAVSLAKASAGLPPERREWVLRVSFADQD